MAMMFTSSCAPPRVPCVSASMLPEASDFMSSLPPALPPAASPSGGTMRNEITSAAGAETMDAISRCATASGIILPRMPA
ncbi:hypothetical protein D3C83_178580 [compost metagenome]